MTWRALAAALTALLCGTASAAEFYQGKQVTIASLEEVATSLDRWIGPSSTRRASLRHRILVVRVGLAFC